MNGRTWLPALVVSLVVGVAVLVAPWFAGDAVTSASAAFDPHAGWLGSDVLGRDVLARVLVGGRQVLLTAAVASVLVEVLAILAAGLHALVPRIRPVGNAITAVLFCLPATVLLVAAMATPAPSQVLVVAVLALVSLPLSVRYLAAAMVGQVDTGYVEDARLAGDPWWRITIAHLVPAVVATIATDAALRFRGAVLLTTTATFIGAGQAAASWPADAQHNLGGITQNPWACLAPLLGVSLLTVPVGLLAARIGASDHRGADARGSARPTRLRSARLRSNRSRPNRPAPVLDQAGVCVRDLGITDARGRPIVQGIECTVAPGTCLAIMGASGAGKSSLARALLGHLPPGWSQQGQVLFDGLDLFAASAGQLRRWRRRTVAHLDQDSAAALTPTMTVRQLLTELDHQQAGPGHWLRLVGLPHDADFLARRPRQLSGGQRRRVALARALSSGARTLVLDEPTSGLDGDSRDQIVALLQRLGRELQLALVVVTHDRQVAAELGQQVMVLDAEAAPPAERASVDRTGPTSGADADPVLSCTDLQVGHGRGAPLLSGFSFELARGTVVAITGPSGCGKTTLVRTLAGLHRARGGSVRRSAAGAGRVALVGQDPAGALNPGLRVGTSLRRAARRAHPRDQVASTVRAIVADPGLPPEVLERRPDQLSGGQRQRLALAVALVQRPDVVLLDEVSAQVDRRTAGRIAQAVRAFPGGVVLVSHDAWLVQVLADQVIDLSHGRAVFRVGRDAARQNTPPRPDTARPAARRHDSVAPHGSASR